VLAAKGLPSAVEQAEGGLRHGWGPPSCVWARKGLCWWVRGLAGRGVSPDSRACLCASAYPLGTRIGQSGCESIPWWGDIQNQ
jgi:hypothetical protein